MVAARGCLLLQSRLPTPPPTSRRSDALLLEQGHELRGLADLEEALWHVGLLAELGDLAEHRQVLVGDFERRRDDEEEEVDRLLVDRLEVDAVRLPAERDAQLVDDERAAVRDGDAAADARGPQV